MHLVKQTSTEIDASQRKFLWRAKDSFHLSRKTRHAQWSIIFNEMFYKWNVPFLSLAVLHCSYVSPTTHWETSLFDQRRKMIDAYFLCLFVCQRLVNEWESFFLFRRKKKENSSINRITLSGSLSCETPVEKCLFF